MILENTLCTWDDFNWNIVKDTLTVANSSGLHLRKEDYKFIQIGNIRASIFMIHFIHNKITNQHNLLSLLLHRAYRLII